MPELVRPSLIDPDFERRVLSDCMREGDFIFANGQKSNNHINLGYEEVSPEVTGIVVPRLAQLVAVSNMDIDFIAPVPKGADGWGLDLAYEIGKSADRPEVLFFDKLRRREFANLSSTELQIKRLKRDRPKVSGLVIDDITTDGGTGEAMADFLTEQGLEVSLVMSILFRGDLSSLKSNYRRAILMARHVPYRLDWNEFRTSGELVPEEQPTL